MFNVAEYLSHLGYSGPAERSIEVLRELHKRHLMTVPFDNSLNRTRGPYIWDYVDIDADATFDAVLRGPRGGVCFELSGLFSKLLKTLGFEVEILSAGVRGPDGTFGPDLEHMFNLVRLDGELWLVDVGFSGPSFLEPLRVTDAEQEQYGARYRLVEDGPYRYLRRSSRAGEWQDLYRFRLQPRRLAEWRRDGAGANEGLEEYGNALQSLVDNGTIIRSRAFATGQRILVGRRYLTVDDGEDTVRVLVRPADQEAAVREVLGDAVLAAASPA